MAKDDSQTKMVLWYFYEEDCGGCDREGEFYNLLQNRMAGISLPKELSVRCINLFTDDDTIWTKYCDKLHIPKEDRKLPMLVTEEEYVCGEEEIYNHLRYVTCQLCGIQDNGTIWYYYRPDCKDCVRIASLVKKQFSSYPSLSYIYIDTTDAKNKASFKEKLKQRNIPEEEWQVPFLDDGTTYLSGDKKTEEKIEIFLQERTEKFTKPVAPNR